MFISKINFIVATLIGSIIGIFFAGIFQMGWFTFFPSAALILCLIGMGQMSYREMAEDEGYDD